MRPRWLRGRYVLPSEHGSWVWWTGPFVVGTVAGGSVRGGVAALATATLAAFLLHQPCAILVKAMVGRYPPRDAAPALGWVVALALVATAALGCVVAHGDAPALLWAAPGAALFVWHLRQVARRRERRRVGWTIVFGAALACAAPAAYDVAGGDDMRRAWLLLAFCAAHTASSITTVYLRFAQRLGPARAWPSALAHAVAAALAVGGVAAGWAPAAVLVPFAIAAADGATAILRPAARLRPAEVGVRQLAVDVAFFGLLAILG